MTSQTDPSSSASSPVPAKKPDLVTAPAAAALVACVVAAMGNSEGSALLTWQLPLGLILLSVAYVALRARSARA
jgi:hypothetical protein